MLRGRYRLSFAACYVYSPSGEGQAARRSRLLCGRLKRCRPGWLQFFAARVGAECQRPGRLAGLFPPTTILVPIPQNPRHPREAPWVTYQLACQLQQRGLASHVWPVLAHRRSIAPSAHCHRWQRPSVLEHWQALGCDAIAPPAAAQLRVVLIDDVVSRGRTLLAAALRLHGHFPQASISAFALFRTLGFAAHIGHVLQPCKGQILWNGRDTERVP